MGRVDHCAGAGLIRGDGTVGALVAENRGCIRNSLSTGEVGVNDNDIDNENVGSLAGRNGGGISNCYSTWWILEGQGCPRLWWEPAPAVEEDAEN